MTTVKKGFMRKEEKKTKCTAASPGRRRFLRTAAGGTAIFAGGAIQFALADAGEVAAVFDELSVLQRNEARSLLMLARTLFPHEFLGDSYYAQAVKQLDSAAAADAARADVIRSGLRQLPQNFVELDTRAREQAVAALDGQPFFKLARRTTVSAVYGNPEVWTFFGYPGPSLPFGGWVNRELVDIDWLPAVES